MRYFVLFLLLAGCGTSFTNIKSEWDCACLCGHNNVKSYGQGYCACVKEVDRNKFNNVQSNGVDVNDQVKHY